MPRDFHKSAYLAEIDDEITIIDFHFDEVGKITKEHIDDVLYWWEYNKRVVTNCNKLILFLISPTVQALDLDDSIKSYIESQKDITYFRLEYSNKPMFWLTDIDETNEKMFEYLGARFDERANKLNKKTN